MNHDHGISIYKRLQTDEDSRAQRASGNNTSAAMEILPLISLLSSSGRLVQTSGETELLLRGQSFRTPVRYQEVRTRTRAHRSTDRHQCPARNTFPTQLPLKHGKIATVAYLCLSFYLFVKNQNIRHHI